MTFRSPGVFRLVSRLVAMVAALVGLSVSVLATEYGYGNTGLANYGQHYQVLGSQDWGLPVGECTWFVAAISPNEQIPYAKSDRGRHAKYWFGRAQSRGMSTGASPAPGAILCMSSGGYGHVAVVLDVQGDTLTVADANWVGAGVVAVHTFSASRNDIQGYIYRGGGQQEPLLPVPCYALTQNTGGILTIRDSPGGNIVGHLGDGERLHVVEGPVDANGKRYYRHERGWTAQFGVFNGVYEVYLVVTNPPGFSVTATAGEGGAILPAGENLVEIGQSIEFAATPNSGFAIDWWKLDGAEVQQGGEKLLVQNVQSNRTVSVSFKPVPHSGALDIKAVTLSSGQQSVSVELSLSNLEAGVAKGVQVTRLQLGSLKTNALPWVLGDLASGGTVKKGFQFTGDLHTHKMLLLTGTLVVDGKEKTFRLRLPRSG